MAGKGRPPKNAPSVFDGDNITESKMENNKDKDSPNAMNESLFEENKPQFEEAQIITEESPTHEVGEAFNPIFGEVKQREYSKNVGVTKDNEPPIERVPEPNIHNLPPPPPPPISDASTAGAGGGGQNKAPEPQKLNPDLNGLPDKDVKVASTLMVDAVLAGYKQVWGFAYEYLKVSDEQIVEWVMQDKISLDIELGINANGDTATLREVYQTFNSQAKSALDVDLTTESFKEVREAMIREFAKRGWGLSDMQFIIQHFLRDAGQRAYAVYSLKKVMKDFNKNVMNLHNEQKKVREELVKERIFRESKAGARVEPSEPTTIKREPKPTAPPPPQEQKVDDFVEKFEMPSTNAKGEEVREVPFYNGNPETTSSEIVVIDEYQKEEQ